MSNTVDTLEQGRVVVEKERSGKELVTKVNGGEPPRETGPTANGTHVVRIASQAEFDKAHRKTTKVHAGLFRRLAK